MVVTTAKAAMVNTVRIIVVSRKEGSGGKLYLLRKLGEI